MILGRLAALLAMWASVANLCATESFAERLAGLQAKLATEPTNAVVLLQLGDLCHDEGANDNREAVKLAEQYLTQLLALDPKHALARAFYGSTLTMKGRDAFWPLTRLSYVKRGIKEMDAAVELAPDDPRVRFVRANNNFFMPKWLEREPIVEADFAWLWEKVLQKPASLDTSTKQLIALHQGQLLKRHKHLEEARTIWKQGITFDPNSAAAGDIRRELERAGAEKS